MLWFVAIRNRRQQCCWCNITKHWPYKGSKRGGGGGEKDKAESVLERREVQNTAHPRSYVSALSGGESIGGDEV